MIINPILELEHVTHQRHNGTGNTWHPQTLKSVSHLQEITPSGPQLSAHRGEGGLRSPLDQPNARQQEETATGEGLSAGRGRGLRDTVRKGNVAAVLP